MPDARAGRSFVPLCLFTLLKVIMAESGQPGLLAHSRYQSLSFPD